MIVKPFIKSLSLITIATTLIFPIQTIAYESGDFIVRAGVTRVSPDESSGHVILDGTTNLGTKSKVNSDTQLGLTFEYMLTPQWGVELLAATPFEHDIKGERGVLANADIGNAKQLPPTLSLMYHIPTESKFDPYVGVGINYTAFFDEELASDTESAVSKGSLDLDNSWGAAVQVGFDYQLNNNWLLNGSVRYLDIDTKASIDFDSGNKATVDVDVDPWVYSLMIGYRF